MIKFNEKVFDNVNLIIVHGGKTAHQDEEVACGIAYAAGARGVEIERRDPTDEELNDCRVLVMDVGMQFDPAVRNFDHHQRGRDEEPKCAYCLVAEFLGIREFLGKVFPWFETGILMDCRGPYATAAALGTDWQKIQGLVLNPANSRHHRLWAADAEERKQYSKELGEQILDALAGWAVYEKRARLSELDGILVMDTTRIPEEYSWLSDAYASQVGANVTVFNDDRGEGLGLFRRNDDSRIDFSRLEGRKDIVFAHKDGFIAKTRKKLRKAGWEALIKAAMV